MPCLNSTDPPARDLFVRMGMGVHKTYLNLRGINSSIFLGSDGLRYALDAQDGNGHVSAEHEEARSLLANFQARLAERRPRTARS